MARRLLSAAGTAMLICIAALSAVLRTDAAAQLLTNGGFEAGLSGWAGSGLSASGCGARSGSAAMAMTVEAGRNAIASQQIETAALPASYVLSGFARAGSGGPLTVTATIRWTDEQGSLLREDSTTLTPAGTYQSFSATSNGGAVAGATVLTARITTEGAGVACVDDVTLDGPLPATVTPAPTSTPSPEPTLTQTRTASPVPASSTPRPPTSTRAPTSTKAATAARTATSSASGSAKTPSAPQTAEALINGGFEEGLAPWQKFGGELAVTTARVNSGYFAGALTSTTGATKWAYQVVRVEGGGSYLFEGYLAPDAGVAEAYLRISWYASDDGSGSAIGNTDSTERAPSGVTAFVHLTTETVDAPAGAHSARARVMLAPASAGRTVLYMDDLGFGPSDAAPRGGAVTAASALDDGTEPPEGNPDGALPGSSGVVATEGPAAATALYLPTAESVADVGLAGVTPRSSEVFSARGQPGGGASLLEYVLTAAVIAGGIAALTAWWQRRSPWRP